MSSSPPAAAPGSGAANGSALPPPDPGSAVPEPVDAAAPQLASAVVVDPARVAPKPGDADGDDDADGGGGRAVGSAEVRRHRWIRRVLRGAALVVVALCVYYLVSLYQVWAVGRSDHRDPVDAIVVMGAAQYDGTPSPQLAARLDHVAELWPEGVAPFVVVTGGNLPGDRFTEASASAAYLVERGVPEEAILREDEGSSSFESLEAVAAILEARGLDEIVIVTDPYHSMRSREIAEEVGLTARVSSTDTSVVTGGESFRRHLQEAGGIAIGRIIGFERLSDLTD